MSPTPRKPWFGRRKTPPLNASKPWVRKACLTCSEDFWVIPSAAHAIHRCSAACVKKNFEDNKEEIKCKRCGIIKVFRKTENREFCCNRCSQKYRCGDLSPRYTRTRTRACTECGGTIQKFIAQPDGTTKYSVKTLCSLTCRRARGLRREGADGKYPKAGHVSRYRDGYCFIRLDFGKWVPEHRYLVEQNIDRSLTKEERIHHRNGDPSDNRLENLQIVSNPEHARIHYEAELIGLRVMTGELTIAEIKTVGALEVLRRANFTERQHPEPSFT